MAGAPPLPRRREGFVWARPATAQVLRGRVRRGDPGPAGLVRRAGFDVYLLRGTSSSGAIVSRRKESGGPVEHGPGPRHGLSLLGRPPPARSLTAGSRSARLEAPRRSADEPKTAGPTDVHQDDGRGRGRLGVVAGRAGRQRGRDGPGAGPARTACPAAASAGPVSSSPRSRSAAAPSPTPTSSGPSSTAASTTSTRPTTTTTATPNGRSAGSSRTSAGTRSASATKFHVTPRDTAGLHRRFGPRQPAPPGDIETIDVLMIHGAEIGRRPRRRARPRSLRPAEEGRRLPVPRSVLPRQPGRGRPQGGRLRPLRHGPGRLQRLRHPGDRSGEVETYPDYLGRSGIRAASRAGPLPRRGGHRHEDAQGRRPAPGPGKYRTGAASVYQAMLKWVLEDARVASAVTEILNRQQMEEDLGAAGAQADRGRESDPGPLTSGRTATGLLPRLRRAAAGPAPRASTRRPSSARSPTSESYGKSGPGPGGLRRRRAAGRPASACRDCGACEKVCPYRVAVRSRIREAGRLLQADFFLIL